MKKLLAIASAFISLTSIPASAHHSLAAYNMGAYKTVDGTVKSFVWTNPHARLTLVVPGADGGSTEWFFEGGSIGRLTSGGFVKDAIAAGDKITVAYNPRRDRSIGGFFIAVTAANGTTYAIDRFRQLKGKTIEP